MTNPIVRALGPYCQIPEHLRQRSLERVTQAVEVEEDGFKFFRLPPPDCDEHSFFKRPEAIQFHYHGRLYKSGEAEGKGNFELFLDLLYVAIIALFSANVSENPDGLHLIKYLLIFFHAYQIWQYIREFYDNYATDDIVQRAILLVIMGFTVIFANNAAKIGFGDDENESCYFTAVNAFLSAHFVIIVSWFGYSFLVPESLIRVRLMVLANVLSFFTRCYLLLVTSWKARAILATTALLIEHGAWFYLFSPLFQKHDEVEFSTAVNIGHESERMEALFIIVLGEFLNATVLDAPASFGLHLSSARAVMVLVIAFCLNWLYVHNDGSLKNTHPIRRSSLTAFTWFMIYEPLCAALVLSGDIAAEYVKLDYIKVKKHEIGLPTIFSYGMVIGIFGLWVLAQITLGKGNLWWPKQVRLIFRVIDMVVIALLPLFDLDTTQTLGIITGLLIATVVWENYGSFNKNRSVTLPTDTPKNHSAFYNKMVALAHTNEAVTDSNARLLSSDYGTVTAVVVDA